MGDVKYSSLSEAIKQIATKIAKEKLKFYNESSSYEENQNEDKQNRLQMLLIEIQKNEEEVKDAIEVIYGEVEKRSEGTQLPKGLKLDVANYISEQVDYQKIITTQQIDISISAVAEILRNNGHPIPFNQEEGQENTNNHVQNSIETFEEYQEEMKEKYSHNYFTDNDFDIVKEKTEEISELIGTETLDAIIQKANTGDRESAIKLMIIQRAHTLIGLNSNVEQIPEDRLRDYLESMILLSVEATSEESMTLCEEMAKKLPEDVFIVDENGQRTIDINKLKDMFKVVDNGVGIDIQFVKKAYDDLAESYIKNPENQFDNADEFTQSNIRTGQSEMIYIMYKNCLQEQQSSPNPEFAVQEFRKICETHREASIEFAKLLSNSTAVKNGNEDRKLFGVLFEAIVSSGVQKKQTTDEPLLASMTQVDPTKAKEILEGLIKQYNEAPSDILGKYIQTLGNAIKEASRESQETSKTEERVVSSNAPQSKSESVASGRTQEDEEDERF